MCIGAQSRLFHAFEEFCKSRVTSETGPQRQRVNKRTNHSLELNIVEIRDGRSHDHVSFFAVVTEQDIERTQQEYIKRHVLASHQGIQLVCSFRTNRKLHLRPCGIS